MKAMVIKKLGALEQNPAPLLLADLPEPTPEQGEIVVEVLACGVCHTELDEIEGRTPPPQLPIVPGHQVVGRVTALGPDVRAHGLGDRVGIAWFYSSCDSCRFCLEGNENLCESFQATGRDANGGYAEYMLVPEGAAFAVPEQFSDSEAAPLLCAGAIGYRALRLTGLLDGRSLGLTGFGASGHIVLKMVKRKFPSSPVFVFARSEKERAFAMELGADWAGDTRETAPQKLTCVIDTTPVWRPVVAALKNLEPGGRLVINAIRKEDVDKQELLAIDYPEHLWLEKEIKTVANISPRDVREFLKLAAEIGLRPEVQEYSLEEANQALLELKQRKIRGAKVLRLDA
ncbi:zinc-dependent alcohol dehydrogenase family protein [Planctomycetota bacterium]